MFRKKRKKIERAAVTTRSTGSRSLRGGTKKVWLKRKPLQGQTSKRSEYEALLAAPPAAEGGRHKESMSLGSKMIFFNHPAAKDEDTLAEFFMQRYGGDLRRDTVKETRGIYSGTAGITRSLLGSPAGVTFHGVTVSRVTNPCGSLP